MEMATDGRRGQLGQGRKGLVCHAKGFTLFLYNERGTLKDVSGQNEMIRVHFRNITLAEILDVDKTRDKETK